MLPFARFLSPFGAGRFAWLGLVGSLGLALQLGRPVRLVAQESPPFPRPEASPNTGYGIPEETTGGPYGGVTPTVHSSSDVQPVAQVRPSAPLPQGSEPRQPDPAPSDDSKRRPTFGSQATSAVAEPPNIAAAPLGPADFETGIRPDTAPVSSPQAPPVTQVNLPPFIRSDKTDTRPRRPGSSQFDGWTSLLTTASSLAVVLGLFFVTAWILRRAGPQASRALPTEALEVLGRAPLAGRQQMILLRCGRRLLLVSVTPDSSETLTEITDPAEVDYLAGLCTQSLANSSTAAFRQVFERFTDRHEESDLEEPGPEALVGHGAEVS